MGTARRARRTADQWATLVEEFAQSGQNEIQFCDERDLGLSSFRKWRYRISAKTAKPVCGGQRSGFASASVCELEVNTQASVNIDLIKSIAQLDLENGTNVAQSY